MSLFSDLTKMASTFKNIPRIPKKVSVPKVEIIEKKEFSGELEGGSLWQILKVEESLIRKILLQLDPVVLMNLEKTCLLIRNLIMLHHIWRRKCSREFRDLLSHSLVKEKYDQFASKENKKNTEELLENEHWSFKVKYVWCWNLKLNWEKGQFLQSEQFCGKFSDIVSTEFVNRFGDGGGAEIPSLKHIFGPPEKAEFKFNDTSIISCVLQVSSSEIIILGKNVGDRIFNIWMWNKNTLELLIEFSSKEVHDHIMFDNFGDESLDHGSSVLKDRIIIYNAEKFCVMQFQLNPPEICLVGMGDIPELVDTCQAVFSAGYLGINEEFKILIWQIDLDIPANTPIKIWELDTSLQKSFPKIRTSSLCLDFPLAYVGKSDGILEVWNVTEEELVNSIDHSELVNAESGSCDIIEMLQTESNVLTLNGKRELFVLDKMNLSNASLSGEAFGYKINYTNRIGSFKVDETCVVIEKYKEGDMCGEFVKFDFWPKYPENFILKKAHPEMEEEQSKKRKAKPGSSSKSSYSKKVHAGNKEDNSESDKDDDYDYKEKDVYDYEAAIDDDHDQFFDDDNYNGEDDY